MTTDVSPADDRAPRTPTGARAPYVLAGVIAAVPLLVLGAAAPGGDSWRWLELPARMTFIAAALGIAACFARSRGTAVLVLLGTAAAAFLWELVHEYLGLKGLGRMDLFRDDLHLIASNTLQLLAPWLVGTLYAALAWLATSPAEDGVRAQVRAALWLAAVGLVAIVLTLQNMSWLTLENLGQRGTFRSSASWPDTKILSLIVALLALVAGAAMALRAWRSVPPRPRLPTATLRE
ncbi:MAG TPA: hypothetical protein VLM79_17455 [Kofleriaceae bacterium]|nr:hypothetical protein [Kofleriaceae bacterium]